MPTLNPACEAFLAEVDATLEWGQIWIVRSSEGFRLCHAADKAVAEKDLKPILPAELRKLGTYNAAGQFRPLRLAPDLLTGWTTHCRTDEELCRAILDLYPGSIPDWYTFQKGNPKVTDYREFTNRQGGMYRISQLLTDLQAAQVTRACCPPSFCLKRRLWSVTGLQPDAEAVKSRIPCLEPCAVLLELARKAARIEQEEKVTIELSQSDLDAIRGATRLALQIEGEKGRIGDIASSRNPRRLQLILEKLPGSADGSKNPKEE